jgi:hypothetical protein
MQTVRDEVCCTRRGLLFEYRRDAPGSRSNAAGAGLPKRAV